MLFNSSQFFIFLSLVLAGYYFVRNSLFQRNLLLVIASYVFYSWWDPRFTFLLLFTSLLDFNMARLIEGSEIQPRRRAFLAISISLNLGVLGTFKYFNFFRESFAILLNAFGANTNWSGWDIVLPVGISFYTFQSMSYVIDVYRRQLPASRSLLQYLAYVSFFPQLVAGPIERGKNLLPQFQQCLTITSKDIEMGIWLVIWGLFKKVAVGDNLAPMIELVYGQATASAPMVVLSTVAFGMRIYCDFSGYSDIARGTASLLGFKLMLNFNLPYLATSLKEFWHRWHISLSTWLRDYLYIPLGGSQAGEARMYINLGVTMLLGGLWHGAALTFLLWGLWHGCGLMVNRWWDEHRPQCLRLPNWLGWAATQAFVLFGWMLFRAQSLDQVLEFSRVWSWGPLPLWWQTYVWNLAILASPLVAMQVYQWRSGNLDAVLGLPWWGRGLLQGAMIMIIIAFWQPEAAPFIYFQF